MKSSADAKHNASGYIYLLTDGQGHYKIGKTIALTERMQRLRIQLPYKVALVIAAPVDNRHAAEKCLHLSYQYARLNGEWFRFDEEDLEWVIRDFHELAGEPTTLQLLREASTELIKDAVTLDTMLALHDEKIFEQEFTTAYLNFLWNRDFCNALQEAA